MKTNLRIFSLLIFSFSFLLAVASSFAQTSYIIVPGIRVGAITKNISESDLKKIYGAKNVKNGEIGLGEGETVTGTIVFPNDQKKRLEIVWKNKKLKKYPDMIQLSGAKSFWKTSEGISLGTSLKYLEKINGKSFTLAGFEWDYSGNVISWNNGKLAKIFGNEGSKGAVRLSPDNYRKASKKDLDAAAGDGEFSSENKAMQRINPKIYQIIVGFP